MVRIPKQYPKEFLFRQQFPHYDAYQSFSASLDGDDAPSMEERKEYIERAESFADELRALPEEELNNQYLEAKRAEAKRRKAKQAAEEKVKQTDDGLKASELPLRSIAFSARSAAETSVAVVIWSFPFRIGFEFK